MNTNVMIFMNAYSNSSVEIQKKLTYIKIDWLSDLCLLCIMQQQFPDQTGISWIRLKGSSMEKTKNDYQKNSQNYCV